MKIWTAAALGALWAGAALAGELPPEIEAGIARACARHSDAAGCVEISREYFAHALATTDPPGIRACALRAKGDMAAMTACLLGVLQASEAELREMMGAPEGADARMLEAIAEACQRDFPGDDTRAETCIRRMVDDLE